MASSDVRALAELEQARQILCDEGWDTIPLGYGAYALRRPGKPPLRLTVPDWEPGAPEHVDPDVSTEPLDG